MLEHFCQWLYDSSVGTGIRESIWVFPIIETIHVLGIALLVGTVAILDLRLLGLALKREPVSDVASAVLPLTWAGFAVMFVSGFLLFWSEAAKSYANPAFRLKLLLLLLVGLNPLIFHFTIYRSVGAWNARVVTPLQARLAAVFSLTLWGGIVCAGRAIAYFQK
ncbi:MAG: DUF6644 family protein [Burkholderiaceae bacterium]